MRATVVVHAVPLFVHHGLVGDTTLKIFRRFFSDNFNTQRQLYQPTSFKKQTCLKHFNWGGLKIDDWRFPDTLVENLRSMDLEVLLLFPFSRRRMCPCTRLSKRGRVDSAWSCYVTIHTYMYRLERWNDQRRIEIMYNSHRKHNVLSPLVIWNQAI